MIFVEDLFLILFLVLGTFFGAAIGSGVMCFISRKKSGESWIKGRSHCDNCKHALGPIDMVPIFSYLFSKGRCRYCHARIPVECLISELVFGADGFVGVVVILPNVSLFWKTLTMVFAGIATILFLISMCKSHLLASSVTNS